MNYLNLAFEAWAAASSLRARRERYKNYTYGKQWCDPVTLPDGRVMDEYSYAESSGRRPMTNNLIRQLVKCVVGRFRSILADPEQRPDVGSVPEAVAHRNSLDELDCRQLEEFLISGCAIQRVVSERRMSGDGVWIDNVSPSRFFVSPFTDPRGTDIELVGMLHDMSLREVLMRFGSGGTLRPDELERIFDTRHSMASLPPQVGEAQAVEFYNAPAGRCRVIEVWTLETRHMMKCHDLHRADISVVPPSVIASIAALNRRRRQSGEPGIRVRSVMTARWRCRYYAPTGEVIAQFDSPYAHGLHPFAVKFYPLTDGEVHSFVEDVVDQQRYVNRLITLIDHIMSVSAKGVLLFPEDQRPEDLSWEEVGRIWSDCQGILPYRRGMSDGEPRQVVASGNNAGAYELLRMQLDLFRQTSGVTPALQGQLDDTRTSASLYDALSRNSTVALLDLLESFNAFRRSRNGLITSVY